MSNFSFSHSVSEDVYRRHVKTRACLGKGLNCFQQHFSYVAAASVLIHSFMVFLLTSTLHNFLSNPLAAFPYNQHGCSTWSVVEEEGILMQ